ncbi:FAD binding domain-containing protein [Trujillonella endophytica]|uniref:Carbon-monoxide dehydrogenase medium subunit n=1 Tax=Trujillonella endophytica TaxID=673521 RepID=A0A1H8VW11_9ACTN|nr:xanthine dehydrogenase family protein subunit M [Trujillella endophytica]SEP19427.1 carbon-monoxide dehydrogenase medium subunit [Trujillella endophytica]
MKPAEFEHHAVDSVEEAVGLLTELADDDVKVLAGGQSLVPLLALRLASVGHLVDVNGVTELATIADGDGLAIGATVRHRQVERSPEVAAANPLLAAAVRRIGHAAIRNRGTIGGTVAHADPAAELPAVLTLLDGSVEVRGTGGGRTIAAADLFDGYFTTTLEPEELLTAVHVPALPAGTGWAVQQFSRRSGDYGIVTVLATLALDGDGRISAARVAYAGVDAVPLRSPVAETALVGQTASAELWTAVGHDAAVVLEPASDLNGSAEYRRHLAATLTARALQQASERAGVRA